MTAEPTVRPHRDPCRAGTVRDERIGQSRHGVRRRNEGSQHAHRLDRWHRPVRAFRSSAERPLHLHGPQGLHVGPRRRDHRREGNAGRRRACDGERDDRGEPDPQR